MPPAIPLRRVRFGSAIVPNPLDVHIGAQIKLRRSQMGASQRELADAMGSTFREVDKHETGRKRITAWGLYHIALALDVPMNFFFEGVDENRQIPTGREDLIQRESLGILRAYYAIPEGMRRQMYELMQAMAREQER